MVVNFAVTENTQAKLEAMAQFRGKNPTDYAQEVLTSTIDSRFKQEEKLMAARAKKNAQGAANAIRSGAIDAASFIAISMGISPEQAKKLVASIGVAAGK